MDRTHSTVCPFGEFIVGCMLQEKFASLFAHLPLEPGKKITDDDLRSLMFGDYLSADEHKVYDEVTDLDQLQTVSSYLIRSRLFLSKSQSLHWRMTL